MGAVLVAIGIAAAVVAVVALQNPKGRQASKAIATAESPAPSTSTVPRSAVPSRSSAPATTAASGALTGAHPVPLVVLDNTATPGLADTARTRFQQGGWTVTSVGEVHDDIVSTCAYYDPTDPAAQPAAVQLQRQFPSIKRVKAKFDGLPAGPIVVVLSTDYS